MGDAVLSTLVRRFILVFSLEYRPTMVIVTTPPMRFVMPKRVMRLGIRLMTIFLAIVFAGAVMFVIP